MGRFFKIVITLILLVLVTAIAVPLVVPAEEIKVKLLAQIKSTTGYDISMDKVSFRLFPTVALTADNVKIANPAWVGGGNMAEIKTLKVGLELMPLLHKQVNLKELTLEHPVLSLVKQQNRANWDMGTPAARAAGEPQSKAESAEKTSSALEQLHLDKIEITDAVITFRDDTTHKTQSFKDFDLTLKAPNLSKEAKIIFSGVYEGKKITFDAKLENPFAFSSGKQTGADLKVGYDKLSFTWKGTVALKNSNHPVITGAIAIPAIDTDDFAGKNAGGKTSSAPPPSSGARWSDAPISLEALKSADADLTVSIGKLKTPKTTLSDLSFAIKLTNGALSVKANPINAYSGVINLALTASAAGNVSMDFAVAKAQAEPFLHDFGGYDRLSGTIDLQTKLNASGHSQRGFISTLAGSGSAHFKDGKLKGPNIAAMLRNLTGAQNSEEGTEFSELSGTFTAARGVITNNDLKMSSPLLRMTGAGTADLPGWQEHFLLKPTLVASLQGQGGKDASGITVPIIVEGPLDHPSYRPDVKAALEENLKDPAKLKENLGNLKDTFKNRDTIQDGLKGLLR